MTNFQKRILTSLIALPLSIFFVIKGGYLLTSFLIIILFTGAYELFSIFKKTKTILFLFIILVLSLFSIYYLREKNPLLLYFAITITIGSDIGGYVFGKIFKGRKLSKISPKKTISGVFGSYFFSIAFFILFFKFYFNYFPKLENSLISILWVVIASTVAQAGDLTISYFKRLEKIKDTGIILPGHGGIFDRIDGLIFVVILTFFVQKVFL